ncbi:hypothetical protein PF005_g5973 [Phytophthora fragariae]|uniref:Uncharacterized protein n=1 Tax=Phytophthora fragariae TaxID=53985 RepID=A0A6A3YU53_9STRA|nr:hypothetical protein PF003_g3374 [Phytophthora fragariae]KAE8944346.1 hypothetical protein PF009_g5961 [Phytophthora fragariae]KAE9021384.1 hypothetical protein PF011_g4963 [Phytophthora fragariae]KAE9126373.1 hypothetical protein PF010_g5286 [Phytophthora fragariae]KAE9127877.1 hypothetical protein PF007_g5450 [Phytophthora fragariae]
MCNILVVVSPCVCSASAGNPKACHAKRGSVRMYIVDRNVRCRRIFELLPTSP